MSEKLITLSNLATFKEQIENEIGSSTGLPDTTPVIALTSSSITLTFNEGVLPTHIKLSNGIIVDLQGNEYCAEGNETVSQSISSGKIVIVVNGDFSELASVTMTNLIWTLISNTANFSFDDLPRFSDSSDVADFPGSSGGTVEAEPIVSIKMTNLEMKVTDSGSSKIADIQIYCTKEKWNSVVDLANTLGITLTYENLGTLLQGLSAQKQGAFIGILLNDYYNGKVLPISYVKNENNWCCNLIKAIQTNLQSVLGMNINAVASAEWGSNQLIYSFPNILDRVTDGYVTADTVITVEEIEGASIGSSSGSGTSDVLYKHTITGLIAEPDTPEVDPEQVTLTFLSKYANSFASNSSLADFGASILHAEDANAIISPMIVGNSSGINVTLYPIVANGSLSQIHIFFPYSTSGNFYYQITASRNTSGITDTVEPYIQVSGGSGGSGKLYDITFDLSLYDQNGDIAKWSSDLLGIQNANSLRFSLLIYESNFERFKTKFNALAQQMSSTISIDEPQDLVNIFNTAFNKTTPSSSTEEAMLLMLTIQYADKCLVYGANNIQQFYVTGYVGLTITLGFIGTSGIENHALLDWDAEQQIDILYGLNVNNSCTLTEYGTSASGGDTPSQSGSAEMQIWEFTFGVDVSIEVYTKFAQSDLSTMLTDTNTNIDTINTMMGISLNHISSFNDIGTLITQSKTIDSTGALTETIIATFMSGLCSGKKTINVLQSDMFVRRTVINCYPTITNQKATNYNCVVINNQNQFVTLQIDGTNAGATYEEI